METEESAPSKSVSDCFDELEPYYLTIGMTHEQYWDDDPWLVWTYREAHKKRMDARSQEMWLQGLYNFQALSTALGNFGNALGGKKRAHKTFEYMKEPIRLSPLSEEEQRAKQRELLIAEQNKWSEIERMLDEREDED